MTNRRVCTRANLLVVGCSSILDEHGSRQQEHGYAWHVLSWLRWMCGECGATWRRRRRPTYGRD